MSNKKVQKETSKGEQFTNKIPTSIFLEVPNKENEFIAQTQYLHGYDMEELAHNLSYPQMLYLMLSGELPNEKQSEILELLLKLLITPGIRHPATRAAMNAGIGRTHVTHILPISLSVLSSDYLGSTEVGNAMRWLKGNITKPANVILSENLEDCNVDIPNPIPGFGTLYGSIDTLTKRYVDIIKNKGFELPCFSTMQSLLDELNGMGQVISWLPTGFAASLFIDLDLNYRTGISLYQILQSPGLAAHGIEKANKPLTDMPFIPESNYEITKTTK